MNLDYVRSEFARMRAQIRRQQNQIEMLSRAYFNAGRIQEIADYCKSDVINTYRLWLRRELFRGRLDQNQFEFSERYVAGRHTP